MTRTLFLLLLATALLACSAESTGSANRSRAGNGGGSAATGAGAVGGTSGGTTAGTTFDNATGTTGGTGAAAGGTTGGAGGEAGTIAAAPDAGAFDLCNAPAMKPAAPSETCGNGLDDDHNGFIDELCKCTSGEKQPCFGGRPEFSTQPECTLGEQTCTGGAEFAGWGKCEGWGCGPKPPPVEMCENGSDDDCDMLVDEGCNLEVQIDLMGDCISAECPPQAPYVKSCNVMMEGNDPRGCIANDGGASVFFKEGQYCGASGHITGTMQCTSVSGGPPLSMATCPLVGKILPMYVLTPDQCP